MGKSSALVQQFPILPECYQAHGSGKENDAACRHCGQPMELKRHISFVDCPGHDVLMATMLNGVSIMDAAALIIASNESCPQPQTREHLGAIEIAHLTNVLVVQNKIDLVTHSEACAHREAIAQFVKGTCAQESPIIPVSAQMQQNIDVLCEYLCTEAIVPVPRRNLDAPARMTIVRSFDINKPGNDIRSLRGGVAGGTITQGVLRIGDEVELRPGVLRKGASGRYTCTPIRTRVVSLQAEGNPLPFAIPGGLIGVGTQLDPALTKGDALVGHVLGHVGSLPETYSEIEVTYHPLAAVAEPVPWDGEVVQVNNGGFTTDARVIRLSRDPTSTARLELRMPLCIGLGGKVTLSRYVADHPRLVGCGEVTSGAACVSFP